MSCLTEISQDGQKNTDALDVFALLSCTDLFDCVVNLKHDLMSNKCFHTINSCIISPNNTISVDFAGKITPVATISGNTAQPYESIALNIISEPLLLSETTVADSSV